MFFLKTLFKTIFLLILFLIVAPVALILGWVTGSFASAVKAAYLIVVAIIMAPIVFLTLIFIIGRFFGVRINSDSMVQRTYVRMQRRDQED